MDDPGSDGLPAEALVLAMVEQLGRLAGELLVRSGYPAGVLAGGRRRGGQPPEQALARLLQQLTSGSDGKPAAPASLYAPPVAAVLVGYWSGQPAVPVLERYGEDVELSTRQGRWELLALAVLMGAPVPRERVEETFCVLRDQGLLDLEGAAEGGAEWAEAVDGILGSAYWGPVNRTRQRERLHRAARTLLERFGGDLQRLWEQAGADPGRCAGLLRESFEGIDRLAAWMVRELGRRGAWPDAHRHPAAFYPDRHLRRAAENLELAGPAAGARQLRQVVEHHFGPDGWVLFVHGRERCGRRSLAVCLKHCPVSEHCRAWRALRPAGGEAPV